MDGYASGLACVEGTEGVDGAGMDFFKKHKRKILLGAGLLAAGLGLYYLTKSKKSAPRGGRALGSVPRARKETPRARKDTPKRRRRATKRRGRKAKKPMLSVRLV